jgi:hypothetical protein
LKRGKRGSRKIHPQEWRKGEIQILSWRSYAGVRRELGSPSIVNDAWEGGWVFFFFLLFLDHHLDRLVKAEN